MKLLRLASAFAGGVYLGAKASQKSAKGSAHQFRFTALDGSPLPLSNFAGRALLVVNTASECGFTPQYEGLEALYKTYGKDGLTVLGVPSNDFGEQEPGTPEEIKNFVEGTYGVTFPMTQKEHAVGEDAHPFYKWASAKAGFLGTPKWNFHKFLIGPNGEFVDWFASTTKPDAQALTSAIEAQLAMVERKAA